MKSIIFISLALLFAGFLSYSQEPDGKVEFVQDDIIEWLLEQRTEINESREGIQGFRVQIYSDSGIGSRLRTEKVKAEFDEKYPETGSYLIYEEPYFKIRVGNFRTRLDARRFLEKISRKYEYAFIVPDKIEFPDFE